MDDDAPQPGPNVFSAEEEQQMRQARAAQRADTFAANQSQLADYIATQRFAKQRQTPPNTPND